MNNNECFAADVKMKDATTTKKRSVDSNLFDEVVEVVQNKSNKKVRFTSGSDDDTTSPQRHKKIAPHKTTRIKK